MITCRHLPWPKHPYVACEAWPEACARYLPAPSSARCRGMHVCTDLTDLRLRSQRRMAGVFASVPATLLAGASAGSYFLTQEIDPSQTLMGVRVC